MTVTNRGRGFEKLKIETPAATPRRVQTYN